ncbi:hypothetical protein A2V82_16460 [candidate division KSB1 bacterium RBG_16_48_16]|nr:MAG: hypothetical protein A2V82_16460 [candidate division KSB1 bacterium RBG_16_48_16]
MWEAVVGLLALLHAALRFYLHRRETRDVHDEKIQEFRKVVSGQGPGVSKPGHSGIDTALADQHDRVLEAVRGSERGGEGNYHEGVAG